MGNVVSFSSPRLEGALTSTGGDYDFATSYAFDPADTNAFGIPATLTFGGDPGPITPVITVPAAATDDAASVYQCNPFPEGVKVSSILCPDLKNTAFNPGIVSIAFTSGAATQGFYSGDYAFSVTTVGGTGDETVTSTLYDTTITTTATVTEAADGATTTTVGGSCSSGSIRPTVTGTGSISGSGSVTPSSNSTMPHPTGSSGFISRSGSIRPSSNSTMPRPTGSSFGPSGSGSSSAFFPESNSTRPYPGTETPIRPSSGGHLPSGGGHPSGNSSSGLQSGSSIVTGSSGAPSKVQTVTNPSATATSTVTNTVTTTIITTITTYVPCSSAIATRGGTTIYSSSLTESHITKTITSTLTHYTVICPATSGSQAPTKNSGVLQRPKTTLIVTKIRYVCPTAPPSCPTAAAHHKRAAGFDGPAFTLSNSGSGPSGEGGGVTVTTRLPSTVTTVTTTSTEYETTVSETGSCSSTAAAR